MQIFPVIRRSSDLQAGTFQLFLFWPFGRELRTTPFRTGKGLASARWLFSHRDYLKQV